MRSRFRARSRSSCPPCASVTCRRGGPGAGLDRPARREPGTAIAAYARMLRQNARLRSAGRATPWTRSPTRGNAQTWLVRYHRRRLRALNHHVEATSELEACTKRIGEATAVFLDEKPTFRYRSARAGVAEARAGGRCALQRAAADRACPHVNATRVELSCGIRHRLQR